MESKGNRKKSGNDREETPSQMSERIERQVEESFRLSHNKHSSFRGW